MLNFVTFRYGIFDPLTRASPGAKMQNLQVASSTQGCFNIAAFQHHDASSSYTFSSIPLYFQPTFSLAFDIMLYPVSGPIYHRTNGEERLGRRWSILRTLRGHGSWLDGVGFCGMVGEWGKRGCSTSLSTRANGGLFIAHNVIQVSVSAYENPRSSNGAFLGAPN